MAERATIARPYAKAAFEYARDSQDLQGWSQSLKAAAQVVADPRVAALTDDPAVSAADLVELIVSVAGDRIKEHARNLLHVLADNHRLTLLPEIVEHFEAERAALEHTVDVEVVSAVPLDAAQVEKLSAALGARLKRRVRMQNSVDAALLGGAVIRAGDMVIDGSLKGRLERLEAALSS
ncbi:MAG TPA: F0F1 ATP synthase subunit delta [Steroidobacteraceae bacterium]|nr:F0F1 ATP synthase subunit delta [Steroidobacteraceae bacterium]